MSESPDEAPAAEGVSTETTDTAKPIASSVPPERLSWQQRLLWFGPWLVVAVAAWMWWSTFTSTSAARIASLQTIEPYAFAVQEQLLHNFNENGSFFQTIHKGMTTIGLGRDIEPSPWSSTAICMASLPTASDWLAYRVSGCCWVVFQLH